MDSGTALVAGGSPLEQAEEQPDSLTITTMVGRDIGVFSRDLKTIGELKHAIFQQTGISHNMQKFVEGDGSRIFEEDKEAIPDLVSHFMLIVDENCLAEWDLEGNPDRAWLRVEGGVLTSPTMRSDFINVLTREPLQSGTHYFKFKMHHIGDEQWCGLTWNASIAGKSVSGRRLEACTYYCGRMRRSGDVWDGMASLQCDHRVYAKMEKPKPQGNIIGMLVDVDRRRVAFDLDGLFQAACEVPKEPPYWVSTHMDTPEDKVELEKLVVEEAPEDSRQALGGKVLTVKDASENPGYW